MAKNETKDRKEVNRDAAKPRRTSRKKWPKVLYPTEPTSIPLERIFAAVDKVIAERKAAERAERQAKRNRRYGKAAGRV